MSTPGAPNPYLHGRTPATVHQHPDDAMTLPGQTRSNQQWAAREIYENSEGRNLMNDFGRPSQTPPTTPPTTPRGGARGNGLKCGSNAVKTRNRDRGVICVRCGINHVKTFDKRANSYYCGFNPEAYAKRTRNRPRGGGKKTKRAKRSHKKTRRAYKKSKSHRKRR